MIPMRTSTVFKNRWMALLWAAGIVWFAYDFAGSQAAPPSADSNATDNAAATADQPTDATGAPISPEDQKKLAAALNGF